MLSNRVYDLKMLTYKGIAAVIVFNVYAPYKPYFLVYIDQQGNPFGICTQIGNIYMKDDWAYLSTTVGIMEINMSRYVIMDTYPSKTYTTSVCIDNNDIYLSTPEEVLVSTRDKNLLDIDKWEKHPLQTRLRLHAV